MSLPKPHLPSLDFEPGQAWLDRQGQGLRRMATGLDAFKWCIYKGHWATRCAALTTAWTFGWSSIITQ